MTTRPRPHIHARDHEHGGADVTRIHYEDVGDSGAGGGDGIQYDTFNVGDWLDVRTSQDGLGVTLEADGDSINWFTPGILLKAPTSAINLTANGILIQGNGALGSITITDTGAVGITGTPVEFSGAVTFGDSAGFAGTHLGFYGVTPVTRAAHPTTLADVITILTNLGLCS